MQNVKDAEQVSRIMQTASTHRGQKIMIAGFTSIVLLIAGFIVYQLKTDGQRISVESSTAELQLPHIFNSKLYPQIVKLEKTLSQMRLSRITENWRYWDRAEEPPSDWNMPAFVDLSWPEGTAPLGYAEENINTQISFGVDIKNKNPTAYFRRKFNIDNINDLNKFILVGLRRDDAAVVYINGTNVYSDDFNSFPVTHTTRPVRMMASVSDEQGYIYFSFDRKFLNNGENTFAVEVHQHRPDSSDLSMEAFITSWIKK